jgi:hypothetical protein
MQLTVLLLKEQLAHSQACHWCKPMDVPAVAHYILELIWGLIILCASGTRACFTFMSVLQSCHAVALRGAISSCRTVHTLIGSCLAALLWADHHTCQSASYLVLSWFGSVCWRRRLGCSPCRRAQLWASAAAAAACLCPLVVTDVVAATFTCNYYFFLTLQDLQHGFVSLDVVC